MNYDVLKKCYPCFANIEDAREYLAKVPCEEPKQLEVRGRSREIISLIYAPDPVTQLPRGDLSMYFSDKVAPEVKAYIQANLLTENKPVGAVPSQFEDSLFELRRNDDESAFDYANRLYQFAVDRKDEADVLTAKIEAAKAVEDNDSKSK